MKKRKLRCKNINKEDLKTGDIIETREGNRYLILEMDNERFNKVAVRDSGFIVIDEYKENLIEGDSLFKELDIMKVYKPNRCITLCFLKEETNIEWTWERDKKDNELTKKIVSAITETLNEMLGEE